MILLSSDLQLRSTSLGDASEGVMIQPGEDVTGELENGTGGSDSGSK